MYFFDIQLIAFKVFGYGVSFVELIATIFGLISVFLAARAHLLTWATGLINIVFLFMLFYQVQLYADMFLQLFFLGATLYGWYNWRIKTNEVVISRMTNRSRFLVFFCIAALTLITGFFFSNIHSYFPHYFPKVASFPYLDSLVMILSIFATVLLAVKKIENWFLWMFVDLLCVFIYLKKEIYVLSFEYLVFLCIVIYGYFQWKKLLK
jgi:nicotinamide mononucleotide transporter